MNVNAIGKTVRPMMLGPRNKYNKTELVIALSLFSECRMHCESELDLSHQLAGVRFNSDFRALWALQSSFTAEEFRAFPAGAVAQVLHYLAGSDYHYTYEKEY